MNSSLELHHPFQLSIEGLALERDQQRLISGFNCQLTNGDLVQLKGPNGCGKTTLIRSIAGLHIPADGDVKFQQQADKDSDHLEDEVLDCFYLGHEHALKADLTVSENLAFYRSLYHSQLPVEQLLQEIALSSHQDKLVKHLSSGQRKRVSLARLLFINKPVWLLDEPLVALDTNTIDWLVTVIEAQIERGGSVLITSHQTIPFKLTPKVIDLVEYADE